MSNDHGNRAARPASARLTVLSGPSGVGKDSLIELIRARSPWVRLSVSVTTRRKRDYEVDGVHYHFVDRPEFERMAKNDELLEWAEFAGNLYGTPRSQVEGLINRGTSVLLKIDIQGARQVRVAMPEDVDSDSRREIQISLTSLAVEIDSLTADRAHRRTRINGHEWRDGHKMEAPRSGSDVDGGAIASEPKKKKAPRRCRGAPFPYAY